MNHAHLRRVVCFGNGRAKMEDEVEDEGEDDFKVEGEMDRTGGERD